MAPIPIGAYKGEIPEKGAVKGKLPGKVPVPLCGGIGVYQYRGFMMLAFNFFMFFMLNFLVALWYVNNLKV